MFSINETLFKFKVVQLEGKLKIYESLAQDISKIASIERAVSEIEKKLHCITVAWGDALQKQGEAK